MGSDDRIDSDASDDTRELGIEFGELKEKLESHEYPTTDDELLESYGDFELQLPGGSATLQEVLGEHQSESEGGNGIRYETPDDVYQSINNMIGSEAVGREDYSDRGGSLQNEIREGENQEQDSM
jgi:hypothetical protein